jgi:hypothetical protein
MAFRFLITHALHPAARDWPRSSDGARPGSILMGHSPLLGEPRCPGGTAMEKSIVTLAAEDRRFLLDLIAADEIAIINHGP